MSGPILLPAPLATSSFVLGQLITDILNPESTSFASPTSPAVKEPSVELQYKDVISHDDDGRLLHSLAGRTVPPYQENLLLVQADEMSHTSLRHPPLAFDALRRDMAAQSFFRKIALRSQPLYYVTGIQTLRNPTFKRALVKEGSVAEVPATADPKLRLPIHVRRDSALELTETSTDAVFGIEVRKVRCRVGSADEPHSIDDIGYVWTYHNLDAEGNEQLSIGLGEALRPAELRALAGIVSDEDFTDRSYDSDDSDGGLAGF